MRFISALALSAALALTFTVSTGGPAEAKKKAASKKMQVICLEDVPYMLPYYDVSISPQRKGLTGVLVNGMSQVSCHDAKG